MIKYEQKARVFILGGKSFDYVMRVNAAGYLQFVYYGAKIDYSPSLTAAYTDTLAPKPDDFNMNMALDCMPSEYGGFGRGDFRARATR